MLARAPAAGWEMECAASLLASLGDRWGHVQAVASKAARISVLFAPEDRALLLGAAYLHDIGYAPSLAQTGFHPLDGACYLRALGYGRLASLVAHHSEARFEAELRGYGAALAEFPHERSALADALTYCDQLTGPTGSKVTLRERAADIRTRYGPDAVVSQAHRHALPYLALAVGRTTHRLRLHGLSG